MWPCLFQHQTIIIRLSSSSTITGIVSFLFFIHFFSISYTNLIVSTGLTTGMTNDKRRNEGAAKKASRVTALDSLVFFFSIRSFPNYFTDVIVSIGLTMTMTTESPRDVYRHVLGHWSLYFLISLFCYYVSNIFLGTSTLYSWRQQLQSQDHTTSSPLSSKRDNVLLGMF